MKRRGTIAALLAALAALVAMAPAAGSPRTEGPAAPASCPAQSSFTATAVTQERAMVCLVNRARRSRGLAALAVLKSLSRAADRKSGDILRCDEFSHEACGREFAYWMTHFGYRGCGQAENIAWGSGSLGTVRAIFRAWMGSQGHRENILGSYGEIGIGLRVGTLEGVRGARVWTQAFGSHNC